MKKDYIVAKVAYRNEGGGADEVVRFELRILSPEEAVSKAEAKGIGLEQLERDFPLTEHWTHVVIVTEITREMIQALANKHGISAEVTRDGEERAFEPRE